MAIYINPCAFYQSEQPITFHRTVMILLMIGDLVLLMVLRLLSIFFHNHNQQRVNDILKKNGIGKDMIKVEEIQNVEGTEQTGINFFPEGDKKKGDKTSEQKEKKQENDRDDSSQSSASSEEDGAEESQIKQKEKYSIELKKLKITPNELTNTYTSLIGHRSICLAFAMLYYPFFHVSLAGLAQSCLFFTFCILRMCGGQNKLTDVIKRSIYFINLIILSLAIHGLQTNTPNAPGSSCIHL